MIAATLTKEQVIDRLKAKFPGWKKGRWLVNYNPDARSAQACCWHCEYRYHRSKKVVAYYPHDDSICDW